MLTPKVANAVSAVSILINQSAANTAAATSAAWVDVTAYEGYLVFTQVVGTITGTLDGIIQHATDNSGTGAATAASFSTQVTTSNDAPNIQKAIVECNAIGPFVRYVGTVGTGPSVVGVVMHGTPKTVP
jgi:hypothetical protein